MQCLKCKNEIPNDVLRCPICGIKVNMHCPECNTLNRFGSKYCIECGTELLKVCLKCGSNNLYFATKCRKCSAPLDNNNAAEEEIKEENVINLESEAEEKETIQGNQQQEIKEEIKPEKDIQQHKRKSLKEFMLEQAKIAEEQQKMQLAQKAENSKNSSNLEFINIEERAEKEQTISVRNEEAVEEAKSDDLVIISKEDNQEKSSTETSTQKTSIPEEKPDIEISIPSPITNTPPKQHKTKVIQNCLDDVNSRPINKHKQKDSEHKSGFSFFGFGSKKNIKSIAPIKETHKNDIADSENEIKNETEYSEQAEQVNFEEQTQQPQIDNNIETIQDSTPEEQLNFEEQEQYQEQEQQEDEIQFLDQEESEDNVIEIPDETSEEPVQEEKKNLVSENNNINEDIALTNTREISSEESESVITADYETTPSDKIVQDIVDALTKPQAKHFIAINGDSGTGKSNVIRQVLGHISEKQDILPLIACCSDKTNISSFGAFQDAFLSLLSLPEYTTTDIKAFIKTNKTSLKQAFPSLNDKELILFTNFLYPNQQDEFSNIIENKEKLSEIIKRIIEQLCASYENIIIAIDNFDYIDSLSYEVITQLIESETFTTNLKFIISYKENKSAEGYFYSEKINPATSKTYRLEQFSEYYLKNIALQCVNNDQTILTDVLWKNIYKNSNSIPMNIEQIFALLYEANVIKLNNDNHLTLSNEYSVYPIPATIDLVIKERLKLLMPQLKTVLYTAALIGYRFDNQFLAQCMNLSDENTNAILMQLKNILYIEDLTQVSSKFRSFTIWKIIEQEAKHSDEYPKIAETITAFSKQVIMSSPLDLIIKFTDVAEDNVSLGKLAATIPLLSALGDIALYTIAQKQKLNILAKDEENHEQEIYLIYEEIGKLNYKKSPQEAIQYLTNAIEYAQRTNNIIKAIDLSGYLVNSCYYTGNYYGAIETIDLVIKNAQGEVSDLEMALIKERKLKALYNLGNCEEIINLMNNDISTTIRDALIEGIKDENLNNLAITAWFEANIILAEAYSMQGNPLSFNIVKDIKNFLPTMESQVEYYTFKTTLVEALAYTSRGDINYSSTLLNNLSTDYSTKTIAPELLSEWNLINLINKILTDSTISKEELFELATIANNTNEYFAKNMIKLILGYIIQKDGDTQKALAIYNEQITYFAKEKNAIGAILCWYLIAQATLIVEDAAKALDIATKALEIAQGPKINNYNFIVYLKKFIAKIYVITGDFESAQMHLEQAIEIAQENGLLYALFNLKIEYSEYLEEKLHTASEKDKSDTAYNIIQVQEEAVNIANELKLSNLSKKVEKAQTVFKTYCKLNNITPSTNGVEM